MTTTDLRTHQNEPAIRALGKLRAAVLAIFRRSAVPLTTRQAAACGSLDILTLRPRGTELRERGELIAVSYDKRTREWYYSTRDAAPGMHDEVMDVPRSAANG